MMEYSDIKKLSELFNSGKKDSDSEDEIDNSSLMPALSSDKPQQKKPYSKIEENSEKSKTCEVADPDCDEDDEKLFTQSTNASETDWKKCPQWNVTYKQQVTPTDVFLQVGARTPSTASCEDMILTIELPGESYQNMDLKVTKDRIKLISPQFFLDVPLPHPVDPQRGNAQWDKENEKLIVTLRMDREFDFMNF